eukprot:286362-Pyramimonas_sp.AAC.1
MCIRDRCEERSNTGKAETWLGRSVARRRPTVAKPGTPVQHAQGWDSRTSLNSKPPSTRPKPVPRLPQKSMAETESKYLGYRRSTSARPAATRSTEAFDRLTRPRSAGPAPVASRQRAYGQTKP